MNYTDFLIPLITGFSGAFTAWFFVRKKRNAETESILLANVEKAAGIWRDAAEGLKKELQEVKLQNNHLLEENKEMREKLKEDNSEMRRLETKTHRLRLENK